MRRPFVVLWSVELEHRRMPLILISWSMSTFYWRDETQRAWCQPLALCAVAGSNLPELQVAVRAGATLLEIRAMDS